MKTIKSYWTYETGIWNGVKNEYINRIVSDIKEKDLKIEIENTPFSEYGPVLKFIGGPTGYESYYIKNLLENPWNHGDFCICGGTINSWAKCWVKTKDVMNILEDYKNSK